jgi:hypothetical protein
VSKKEGNKIGDLKRDTPEKQAIGKEKGSNGEENRRKKILTCNILILIIQGCEHPTSQCLSL